MFSSLAPCVLSANYGDRSVGHTVMGCVSFLRHYYYARGLAPEVGHGEADG